MRLWASDVSAGTKKKQKKKKEEEEERTAEEDEELDKQKVSVFRFPSGSSCADRKLQPASV